MRLNHFSIYLEFLKRGALENFGKDSHPPLSLGLRHMVVLVHRDHGLSASAEQLLYFLHPLCFSRGIVAVPPSLLSSLPGFSAFLI